MRQISNVSPETYDDGYTDIARYGAASFVILNTKKIDGADWAFVTTGSNGSLINTTWAYNLKNDLWNKVEGFSGSARTGATGFSVANKGFIYSGNSGANFYGDLWEYIPY